jgi:hypothetical protein
VSPAAKSAHSRVLVPQESVSGRWTHVPDLELFLFMPRFSTTTTTVAQQSYAVCPLATGRVVAADSVVRMIGCSFLRGGEAIALAWSVLLGWSVRVVMVARVQTPCRSRPFVSSYGDACVCVRRYDRVEHVPPVDRSASMCFVHTAGMACLMTSRRYLNAPLVPVHPAGPRFPMSPFVSNTRWFCISVLFSRFVFARDSCLFCIQFSALETAIISISWPPWTRFSPRYVIFLSFVAMQTANAGRGFLEAEYTLTRAALYISHLSHTHAHNTHIPVAVHDGWALLAPCRRAQPRQSTGGRLVACVVVCLGEQSKSAAAAQ